MTELRTAVRAAAARLSEAGIASAESDAVLLPRTPSGSRSGTPARRWCSGRAAPAAYEALVELRAARPVPLQHLTGRAGFRRLELSVGPGVFVPRPRPSS